MSSTEAPFSLALRTAACSNRSRVLRSAAIASKEPKDNSVFSASEEGSEGTQSRPWGKVANCAGTNVTIANNVVIGEAR
jgi:hypothetical protein